MDILKAAVLHTAQKRKSLEDIKDWKDILKDLREEPQMYLLWDNYIAENKYIGNLKFHVVLDTVEEIAQILDFDLGTLIAISMYESLRWLKLIRVYIPTANSNS